MLTLADSCVLPDGLEIERETVQPNQPPRVVAQEPDPLKGLTLPRDSSAPSPTLRLTLTDPNHKDKLYIRLFVDYYQGKSFGIARLQTSAPTTAPDVARPAIEFSGLSCTELAINETPTGAGGTGAAGSGMPAQPTLHLLEAVVSDREFDEATPVPPIHRRIADGAFSDTVSWVFTCGD